MEQYEADVVKKTQNFWSNIFTITNAYVSKTSLAELDGDSCEILPPAENANSLSMELFTLRALAYNPEEGIIDKLVSVYSSLHSLGAAVFTIIHGRKDGTADFHIGCRCPERANAAKVMLKKNFEGNFPGIELESHTINEKEAILDELFPLEYARKSIVSLSVSADYRREKTEENVKYLQGIEKFIDTMRGEEYTALFLAEPISKEDCQNKRMAYENIVTELSKYNKVSLSYNQSESNAVNESLATSVSDTITDSINHSVTKNTSTSIGKSKGKNRGRTNSFLGMGWNSGTNSGKTTVKTTGESYGDTTGQSKGVTNGSTTTSGNSKTDTAGSSITLNVENKGVTELITKIEYELRKIDFAESFGLWDTAIYLLSESEEIALIGANSIRSLVIGDNSGKAESFINVWGNSSREYEEGETGKFIQFLHNGMHPVFKRKLSVPSNAERIIEEYIVTPAIQVGGNALPALFGLPMKSLPGITILETAEFNRNIVSESNVKKGKREIALGEVLYMGHKDKTLVDLVVNSLSEHTFICGAPGSGKSNTIYKIINGLVGLENKKERDEGCGRVRFLVIEPAKGEYKYEFAGLKDVHIFTTQNDVCRMLCINPFEFPYEFMDITEHIDKLKNVISACWPLTAAMPAILADALEKAYMHKGWDINNSVYVLPGEVEFPTFQDVLDVLPGIIEHSDYSSEAKGDYKGALITRVSSMTNGIAGKIFKAHGIISDKVLFDEDTIIDLSNIGSTETRALIMGVLVMKLGNYRRAKATQANAPLKHVTILEEAHNVLPRCSTQGSDETANVQGKSVELLSAAISEMRTYGEGFIIADQTPSAVARVAISNTSTKIIMRLPAQEDVDVAGGALSLTDNQKKQLPMLQRGQAVVKQDNWAGAVMVQVGKAQKSYYRRMLDLFSYEDLKQFRGVLIEKIIDVNFINGERNKYSDADKKKILKLIHEQTDISEYNKAYFSDIWEHYCSLDKLERKKKYSKLILDILECSNALLICQPEFFVKKESVTAKEPLLEIDKLFCEWGKKIKKILNNYVITDTNITNMIFAEMCRFCKENPPSDAYKKLEFISGVLRNTDGSN